MTGIIENLTDGLGRQLEQRHGAPRQDTLGATVLDAAVDQTQNTVLQELGYEALSPAADVALDVASLAVGTITPQLFAGWKKRRIARAAKKKAFMELSAADKRQVRAAQRRAIRATLLYSMGVIDKRPYRVPAQLLDGMGEFKPSASPVLISRDARRKINKANLRRVARGALLSLAGRAARRYARTLTAGTVAVQAVLHGAAPIAAITQAFAGMGVAAAGAVVAPFAVAATAFVATAVGLHHAIHFVTGRDDPLAPLADYLVVRALRPDRAAVAKRIMHRRYDRMGRHVASTGKRIARISHKLVSRLTAPKPASARKPAPVVAAVRLPLRVATVR